MRFFFNIQDKVQILDGVGREFAAASEAAIFARQLAADLTDMRGVPGCQ
jgi:uncharacterized protein DUF6894